ncbi:hypothetical protein EVAR_7246_1 [Eumeta japonica]|uniref:Uncharacterized protein n=1 Tax=Eumeta variegata TaxID=151549 RepID=A0A4C1T2J9_EUMVA|nr:hypothetical protein EVAR_7246_1 [Eumeta japonica]
MLWLLSSPQQREIITSGRNNLNNYLFKLIALVRVAHLRGRGAIDSFQMYKLVINRRELLGVRDQRPPPAPPAPAGLPVAPAAPRT